jgi:hypothetical protein
MGLVVDQGPMAKLFTPGKSVRDRGTNSLTPGPVRVSASFSSSSYITGPGLKFLDPRSLDLVIAEAITYWAEIRAQGGSKTSRSYHPH